MRPIVRSGKLQGPYTPCLPMCSSLMRTIVGLLVFLLSLPDALAACANGSTAMIDLRVTSDRGEGFDRLHRIRVFADGCVEVRRPRFHREPGEFSAMLANESLRALARIASDPALRTLDPEHALREAEAALSARGKAAGELHRTYVSHPTGYVLRLNEGDEVVELKLESVFQHAELHPESAALASFAGAVSDVLALDALPDLVAEVQP